MSFFIIKTARSYASLTLGSGVGIVRIHAIVSTTYPRRFRAGGDIEIISQTAQVLTIHHPIPLLQSSLLFVKRST